MVLGLRGVKKHGFYGVFCSENVQKTRKHHLFDHFSAVLHRVSNAETLSFTMFFVRLAWQKYVLQHAENCVNTTVFARFWPENTVNTVVFGSRSKNPCKYRGFGLARRQKKTRFLRSCLVREYWKNTKTQPIWPFFGFTLLVVLDGSHLPGYDVAKNELFPLIPAGKSNCRPARRKSSKSGSKRVLARLWPKTAVFIWFQMRLCVKMFLCKSVCV